MRSKMKFYSGGVEGERYCRIEEYTLERYNNLPITIIEVEGFTQHLKEKGFSLPEIIVEFKEPMKNYFGFAYEDPWKIELIRHSISTFIHEFSHIIEFQKGNYNHNKSFGETMTVIFQEYLAWEK